MDELFDLRFRHAQLKLREPTGSTSLGEGMQWLLEMGKLSLDAVDYQLKVAARALPQQ